MTDRPSPRLRRHCPICGIWHRRLERHHLVPKASRGDSTAAGVYYLCGRCHDYAHQVWGEGDRYIGPTKAHRFEEALRWMLHGKNHKPNREARHTRKKGKRRKK